MRRVAVGLAAVLAVSFTGPAIGESEMDQIQDAEQPARRSTSPSAAAVGFRSAVRAAPPCSEESAGPCSEPGAERQTGAQIFRLIPTSRWPAIRSTTRSQAKAPRISRAPTTTIRSPNSRELALHPHTAAAAGPAGG
jgi:hypothetical protein